MDLIIPLTFTGILIKLSLFILVLAVIPIGLNKTLKRDQFRHLNKKPIFSIIYKLLYILVIIVIYFDYTTYSDNEDFIQYTFQYTNWKEQIRGYFHSIENIHNLVFDFNYKYFIYFFLSLLLLMAFYIKSRLLWIVTIFLIEISILSSVKFSFIEDIHENIINVYRGVIPLFITAPYILIIWIFRENDRYTELELKEQEFKLKEQEFKLREDEYSFRRMEYDSKIMLDNRERYFNGTIEIDESTVDVKDEYTDILRAYLAEWETQNYIHNKVNQEINEKLLVILSHILKEISKE